MQVTHIRAGQSGQDNQSGRMKDCSEAGPDVVVRFSLEIQGELVNANILLDGN